MLKAQKRSIATAKPRHSVQHNARKSKKVVTTQKRHLNLHEYQSREIMSKYNVRVTRGGMASSVDEAKKVTDDLANDGINGVVIKAQIHAGGRGKGHFKEDGFQGGVHPAANSEQVSKLAQSMLGKHLVTKQTGPDGQLCTKLLIAEAVKVEAEKYFAILLDRTTKGPVLVVSPQGGMNIEEVAAKTPEAVKMIPINITRGITDTEAGEASEFLGFTSPKHRTDAIEQIKALYDLFVKSDCTQVEINPLALANDKVYSLDAKLNFDDNAAFRQKDIFAMRDLSMEDSRDVAASKFDLNYVGLDGNIGCLVNGAGLAMATMDIVKLYGGEPANFLDVGGGASPKQVEEAFKIITSDTKVKGILVNIFGGIMKCDVIAEGIIAAAKNLDLRVPLVVRLEGTNVQKGVDMLNSSGLAIISATNLDEAAQKAVASIKKM